MLCYLIYFIIINFENIIYHYYCFIYIYIYIYIVFCKNYFNLS